MTESEYGDRLKFEHELINRRLTWLLTSQSILFAAYSLALRPDDPPAVFLLVTPWAGIAISFLIFVGVACGVFAKHRLWKDYKEQRPKELWGVRTWITVTALFPDLGLPLVFIGAWLWILPS